MIPGNDKTTLAAASVTFIGVVLVMIVFFIFDTADGEKHQNEMIAKACKEIAKNFSGHDESKTDATPQVPEKYIDRIYKIISNNSDSHQVDASTLNALPPNCTEFEMKANATLRTASYINALILFWLVTILLTCCVFAVKYAWCNKIKLINNNRSNNNTESSNKLTVITSRDEYF